MPRCGPHYGRILSVRGSFRIQPEIAPFPRATITSLSCQPHTLQSPPVVKPVLWHSFGKKTNAEYECREGKHSSEYEVIESRMINMSQYWAAQSKEGLYGLPHRPTLAENHSTKIFTSWPWQKQGPNLNHLLHQRYTERRWGTRLLHHTQWTLLIHTLPQKIFLSWPMLSCRPQSHALAVSKFTLYVRMCDGKDNCQAWSRQLISHEVDGWEREWLLGRNCPRIRRYSDAGELKLLHDKATSSTKCFFVNDKLLVFNIRDRICP